MTTTRVLQLSDTHFTADPLGRVYNRSPDARLRLVLDALDVSVDALLITGDLADDGLKRSYERLAEALASLGVPIIALPGNHDDPGLLAEVLGGSTYWDAGTWRIVTVPTAVEGQVHGRVDVPAALMCLDDLDERPTILAAHHPPCAPSEHPWFQLDGGEALARGLAARPHVRAVAAGHLHEPYTARPHGVTVFGCPSSLVGIRHHGARYEVGGATTGARLLNLHDDGTVDDRVIVA